MKILAIETSCDETSAAVVDNENKILSNIVSSQIDIHREYGGVVPEIASRHHIENILPVFEEALSEASCKIEDIDYIAVTNTPGLIGALLVGLMFAKSLSYAQGIPLLPINHIEGHIFSSFIEHDVELPALSFVISGGHTNLYYMDKEYNVTLIGEALDDAVGESYDKIARILDLRYPGGPEIDKLSNMGEYTLKITKPVVDGYNFSFSGVKTFVTNYVNNQKMKGNEIIKADIAKSFQETVVSIISDKLLKAANEYDVKSILFGGGVSANKRLREKIKEIFQDRKEVIVFPSVEYCTDNAAMIGVAANYKLKKENDFSKNEKNIDAIPTKI